MREWASAGDSPRPRRRALARRMTLGSDYFDDLYGRRDDPWRLAERWYERRKHALTVAALPRQRASPRSRIRRGQRTHRVAGSTTGPICPIRKMDSRVLESSLEGAPGLEGVGHESKHA